MVHPLPLPLGKVAERSEDGGVYQGAIPSQSPSATALPKGEPRGSTSLIACCHKKWSVSLLIRSTNCFTAIHQTDSFLFLLSNWKTSLFQRHNLIDPALMARFPGKFRGEPDVHDLHRQIFAYDPRAQRHHVGVVV